MNGVHDMGGMHGLGPVAPEPNDPVFHADWERRVFAMTVATGYSGKWNIDMSRYSREQMPGPEYLAAGYYDYWLHGLETLLEQNGLVTRAETAARMRDAKAPAAPAPPGARVLKSADVEKVLRDPRGARVDEDVPSKFKVGDRVRTKNINPVGHTRLPRYARGHVGVVDRDMGVWVFPDTNAAGQGQKPQHVSSVRFTARELWGADARANDAVYLDLWDDYLEKA